MNKIFRGIQEFQKNVVPQNRDLFQRLASGQHPEALYIGCSDSRVAVDLITQTSPGDLFVCRNAGNIVPAHGGSDAVSATIEYAVCALNIQHIVVCGHSDCGAMKGLLRPELVQEMPLVRKWLRHSEGAAHALDAARRDSHPKEALAAVTRLNVRLQIDHLRTHPHVFARVEAGKLQLHGWVYDIESGQVAMWDAMRNEWNNFSSTVNQHAHNAA